MMACPNVMSLVKMQELQGSLKFVIVIVHRKGTFSAHRRITVLSTGEGATV
jgi:ABC-type bacteriocin/lantibiotic exporter with double-glycine peptidase domain